MRGKLAKKIFKLKLEDKVTFCYSPSEEWIMPAASTINPEEREFVVDSGASMHTVSKKDLDKAELATVRTSKNSHDGGASQRRGVGKRRGNGTRPRFGFIRDGNAS